MKNIQIKKKITLKNKCIRQKQMSEFTAKNELKKL